MSTVVSTTSPAPVRALTLEKAVAAANRWRENYNPLRGLTISRAVMLLESYPRGIMADLQWTYQAIEGADADMIALIERRTSALLQMDWNVKAPDKDKLGREVDGTLAQEQIAALTEAYEGVDNLYDAIEHLGMATFRGFSHLEKHRNADGDIFHLEPVDQWNAVRDGLRGAWRYNPEAMACVYGQLPAANDMLPEDFLFREVRRPIGRIALVKFIRMSLSDKDWDGFIEIYGIPGGVVVLPPNVPEEQEAEYQSAAEAIASGGSGALPNGADYKPNDGPRGSSPFKERLQYLTEQIVLAGTGGLLTMLAHSGTGTLAGSAHMETFEIIARAEARRISATFQRDLDAELLAAAFPGQPRLAYWELAANEETDVSAFIDAVGKLGLAGYQVSPEQVRERTGYEISLKPAAPSSVPLYNRRTTPQADDAVLGPLLATARANLLPAIARDLAPLRNAVSRLLGDTSDKGFLVKAAILREQLPAIGQQMTMAPASEAEWEKLLGSALALGMSQAESPKKEAVS